MFEEPAEDDASEKADGKFGVGLVVLLVFNRCGRQGHTACEIMPVVDFAADELIEVFLDVAVEFFVEFFDAEGVGDVVKGGFRFLAEGKEPFGGGAAGFAGAQKVGEAFGGRFANFQTIFAKSRFPCDEAEAVVIAALFKDGNDAVGAFLVDQFGDQTAEFDAVAVEMNTAGLKAQFNQCNIFAVGQPDGSFVGDLFDNLFGGRDGSGLCVELRAGEYGFDNFFPLI